MTALWLLTALIFTAAVLYSSVGHAGASGYLAAMALCGIAPEVMRPAALVLNIVVATIGSVRYYRAGCFSWRLLLPLAAGSIPCAFLGGYLALPSNIYRPVVGTILLLAAVRLALEGKGLNQKDMKPFPVPLALACGAAIGLLSGLTGTGGGIFLSPLLLFIPWATTKQASGVSAAFILVNSVAGLLGVLSKVPTLPNEVAFWVAAATVGGFVGSELGTRRLGNQTLRRLLAVVLVVAGLKMILT
jgi:uncharacterized protein